MDTILDLSAYQPSDDEFREDEVSELGRLRREVTWLRGDNADLRSSAFHWRELYEASVERANDLETRVGSSTKPQSAPLPETSHRDGSMHGDPWLHGDRSLQAYLRHLRVRVRCAIRTGGLHQFELSTKRCMYCRTRWEDASRQDRTPSPLNRLFSSCQAWSEQLFRPQRRHT